jgi:urease accessory protein
MFAPGATALPSASHQRHQRVDGRARLVFGQSGIRDLSQVAPARLMFPDARDGDHPLIVTIATSGGLTGGDRLAFDIEIEAGASATIVSQAAEKLYRALDEDAATQIDTRLRVGAAGDCEWLAQEAILFDRSRMRRSLEIDLAGDARVLALETLVLGRHASLRG